MPTLFDPIKLGALDLPNRIFMAPLTRVRATPDGQVPTDMQREHYVQRASAGLIFAEATCVSRRAVGYVGVPGIWSDEQTAAWKKIVDGVHAAGGRIVLQLWHAGRVSHSKLINGQLPLAPSPIKPAGHVALLRPITEYETPHALTLAEIPGIIAEFKKGAENAMTAGFDGVHIHSGNGYLLDQFLQDSTNQRTDQYGGSVENRVRLLLEVTDAVSQVWGADRVGMHLSPRMDTMDMGDSDPLGTFSHLARELGKRKLGWLLSREYVVDGNTKLDMLGNPQEIANQIMHIGPRLKEAFGGPYIANEGFTLESAHAAMAQGWADAVAFGKLFISNPDLPRRFAQKAPLNAFDPMTFYANGREGYNDYPTLP